VTLLDDDLTETSSAREALIEEAREAQRRRYRRWGGGFALLAALVAGGFILFAGGGGPPTSNGSAPSVIHASLSPGILARAADPSGGLPWGTGLVRARGWSCVQVGRLKGVQLGEVGIDNVYHDDGKFHPFGLATNHHTPSCVPDDGSGNAFMTVELGTIPASSVLVGWNGSATGGGCDLGSQVASAHQAAKRRTGRAATFLANWSPPTCPAADERFIQYGLLGPQAQSVEYTYNGRHLTERTGPDGAYLLVGPATPKFCSQFGQDTMCGGSGQAPNSIFGGMITSVRYRNGQTCRPTGKLGIIGRCPEVGYVAPKRAANTGPVVSAPVSVKVVTAKHYCFARGQTLSNSMPAPATQLTYIPCDGSVPANEIRDPDDQQGSDLIVSWTARMPTTAGSSYEGMITWHHTGNPPQGCPSGSGVGVRGRVQQGERLTIGNWAPAQCVGTYTGSIYFDPSTDPNNDGGGYLTPGQDGAILVGRFKTVVP
jgi:hypothetical protein